MLSKIYGFFGNSISKETIEQVEPELGKVITDIKQIIEEVKPEEILKIPEEYKEAQTNVYSKVASDIIKEKNNITDVINTLEVRFNKLTNMVKNNKTEYDRYINIIKTENFNGDAYVNDANLLKLYELKSKFKLTDVNHGTQTKGISPDSLKKTAVGQKISKLKIKLDNDVEIKINDVPPPKIIINFISQPNTVGKFHEGVEITQPLVKGLQLMDKYNYGIEPSDENEFDYILSDKFKSLMKNNEYGDTEIFSDRKIANLVTVMVEEYNNNGPLLQLLLNILDYNLKLFGKSISDNNIFEKIVTKSQRLVKGLIKDNATDVIVKQIDDEFTNINQQYIVVANILRDFEKKIPDIKESFDTQLTIFIEQSTKSKEEVKIALTQVEQVTEQKIELEAKLENKEIEVKAKQDELEQKDIQIEIAKETIETQNKHIETIKGERDTIKEQLKLKNEELYKAIDTYKGKIKYFYESSIEFIKENKIVSSVLAGLGATTLSGLVVIIGFIMDKIKSYIVDKNYSKDKIISKINKKTGVDKKLISDVYDKTHKYLKDKVDKLDDTDDTKIKEVIKNEEGKDLMRQLPKKSKADKYETIRVKKHKGKYRRVY